MNDLTWGILGTAGIARKAMLPALRAAEGCRLGAIASRDVTRAEAMARDFDIPRAYGSYEALLADPWIDVIYNPLPNHLHVPLTLQALAAGKHVLCEKPLALTLSDARNVTAAAQDAGRVVAEAFMTRHHPQWRRARDMVSSGRIGRLNGVQAMFSYCNNDPGNVRNQKAIGGGGLYDVGCYAVDTARFFFGSEPEAVSCLMDIDPDFGTDRLTTGAARFAGGGQLSFTVSTQSALVQQLTLLGSDGYLVFDAPFNCPADHPARLAVDSGADLLGGGRALLACPPVDQYRLQAETFAQAVRQARPDPATAGDILGNAATLEALARAAQSHRWEAISPTTNHAGD
ncbi:putative dehydrogenase [Sagittula marina]|uniref:Putative dehydrogenase n=1 Tax=Sagittula marina TaxID=943940 RepID=A0A7W6DT40_9RHOB|nr:Gfo/Idh/MocA family oxidoreductase [Sagittula marina]MBB3988329.1 putative dehydrogenase [Sagittula marina]